MLYLNLFFSPVQQLSGVFDGYQQARVGLRRIADLLRTPTSVEPPADPLPVPARLSGAVDLVDVTFRYPGTDQPALENVTLSVSPGETVALVGATGAGKSTVVKLIARFYDPTTGAVLVDGVDLRDFDPSAYRQRLGVVPQEPHLFTGDVASNVAYGGDHGQDGDGGTARPPGGADDRAKSSGAGRTNGRPKVRSNGQVPAPAGGSPNGSAGSAGEANRVAVEAAVRAVGALPMVAGLAGGFRHQVGERGQGLSAGQRQLIALARAELVHPDVLLLDEATAALDPATESVVLAASEQLAAPAYHVRGGAPPGDGRARGPHRGARRRAHRRGGHAHRATRGGRPLRHPLEARHHRARGRPGHGSRTHRLSGAARDYVSRNNGSLDLWSGPAAGTVGTDASIWPQDIWGQPSVRSRPPV